MAHSPSSLGRCSTSRRGRPRRRKSTACKAFAPELKAVMAAIAAGTVNDFANAVGALRKRLDEVNSGRERP